MATSTGAPLELNKPVAADNAETAIITYLGGALQTINDAIGNLSVSATDYGAAVDGTTDDSAAIQAALTAAAGKSCFLPPGTYLVNTKLTVPSSTVVYGAGPGTILKAGVATIGAILENSDTSGGNVAITIRDLTIDGNTALWTAGDPDGTKDSFSGIHLVNVTSAVVEDVVLTGVYCHEASNEAALMLDTCVGARVSGVRATNNKQSAVYLKDCTDCQVDGVTAYQNGGSGVTSSGIARCTFSDIKVWKCADSTLTSGVFSGVSINGTDCLASNVVSRENTGSGINVGHDADGNRGDRTRLVNCIGYSNTLDGLTTLGSTGVVMTNCEGYGNTRFGINITDNSTQCRLLNCVARANVGASSYAGIQVSSGARHYLGACEAAANNYYGIRVENPDEVVIDGCICRDNSVVGAGYGGILLSASDNSIVRNCHCYDTRSAGARTQTYGLQVSNCANPRLENNWNHNNVTLDYRETGTVTGQVKVDATSDGDLKITGASNGLLVTTPDGTHVYRIRIANDGTVAPDLVS